MGYFFKYGLNVLVLKFGFDSLFILPLAAAPPGGQKVKLERFLTRPLKGTSKLLKGLFKENKRIKTTKAKADLKS